MILQTHFASRSAQNAYLAEHLHGLYSGPATDKPNQMHGGRNAALEHLQHFTAQGYGRRNHTDAPTSRLSAYLRHGVLNIREVASHIRRNARGRDKLEFLKQLAWREFFALVLAQEGQRLLENLEPPKYNADWVDALPEDVREAQTGLPCVDGWVRGLVETGHLHNHERLWFGAYLVHWRGVHWKAGYRFFREHLLDGDIASNAASWQWVASTFAHKPYFMNQENIAKYSQNTWCADCKAACPFAKSYAQLEQTLFGGASWE